MQGLGTPCCRAFKPFPYPSPFPFPMTARNQSPRTHTHRSFYEGGCQGYSFPYLGVVGPDIRVPHDAQQGDHPGDDDKSFLISTPLLFFCR